MSDGQQEQKYNYSNDMPQAVNQETILNYSQAYTKNDFTRDDYTTNQQQYNNNQDYSQQHQQQQVHHQQEKQQLDTDDGTQSEPEKFRKLFVANLNIQTNEDSLKTYFAKYGQVVDAVIVKEPKTNKTRCYGFVTFQRASSVDDVMRIRPHAVDGREIETKRATPREDVGKPGAGVTTKQLFVGGIKEGMSEENLREVFGQYGAIKDVNIMKDKETNAIRGFAFVLFEDYDPVDRIVLEKYHTINGYSVSVKKALPKESEQGAPVRGGGKRGGGYMGGRGGGGGYHNDQSGGGYQSAAPMGMGGYDDFNGGMSGPPGLDNLAFMAQKMLQAAQAGGFPIPAQGGSPRGGFRGGMRGGRGGGRGGASQSSAQMNFASDDFDTFNQFAANTGVPSMQGGSGYQMGGRGGGGGSGVGGPMRGRKFSRGGSGPYGRGYGRGNKA